MVDTEEQILISDSIVDVTINTRKKKNDLLWYIVPLTLMALCAIIIFIKFNQSVDTSVEKFNLDGTFFIYLTIGFFAQMVDGTLGMGYGATSTSCLLAFGVSPAVSSASVHIAEMFASGVATITNHKFKNINKKLVYYLLIPGVAGAFLGSYILSNMIDAQAIKPYINLYMIGLAIMIILKGFNKVKKKKRTKNLGYLAVFGGFMDSVGGGGWGPIVTSTLVGKGRHPVYTIGSVNAAEFAIAFTSGFTFLIFGAIQGWTVILGLVLGGIASAPLASYLLNRINRKYATIFVGLMIIILSLNSLAKTFL